MENILIGFEYAFGATWGVVAAFALFSFMLGFGGLSAIRLRWRKRP